MSAKEKTIKLLDYSWSSQMIENNKKQRDLHKSICELLNTRRKVEAVVDGSQCWSETPQGQDYWEEISNDLLRDGV